ncbi:PerC family transcriptional regulator [Escherichia coli]|uniref:PerC family transcriptional regulator n=1 Tax=Escherichia TaxID=561 RepID=UPI0015D718B8|nr:MULTISPECIES: PerC family transcriptional regulator [Escherichia]EHY3137791.1 PerC family transcriptional regulator [Escherichia coli]EJK6492529.1 PerC family transcriptional regulator [Escherichia coli]MBA7740732.1 PerC family transcriptional regulator [Escherichia marmotae]MBA7955380.1 PerC family transcriptional regulator [Escherichia marmotae]MCI5377122.1 PerC family transcriptional regulator [Escherichia coli]
MEKLIPQVVEDSVAQKLEAAGHWRRASTRWGELMSLAEYTEKQREWLYKRIIYCHEQIKPVRISERLDIREISKAADAALIRMKIASIELV